MKRFHDYEFISIVNCNSEPSNTRLIASSSNAYLADTNIQFEKKLEASNEIMDSIQILNSMKYSEKILEMTNYQYSKFMEDPELRSRGGANLYQQWLLNSFEKDNKYFALSFDSDGEIDGYLLHSYSVDTCTIELIQVAARNTSHGQGTRLFRAVEQSAIRQGCSVIQVGTQLRNLNAMNFYYKVGCKVVGCHQVYHLWNLNK
jgi:GNAT superfamily N-acetyltransferase